MSDVLNLYRSGKSAREIAVIVGVSVSWVYCKLASEKKHRRPRDPVQYEKQSEFTRANNPRVELLEKSLSLVASGCSYGEAATRLGLTRNDVAGYVFRAKKRAARL